MSEHQHTHFELRRNWLLGGYSSEFSTSFQLKPHLASVALDVVARTLRSQICHEGEFHELRNIKGRDTHEAALLDGAPALVGEELFAVGGTIATGSDTQGFIWEPFHFSCHTRFNRFEGSRAIIHSAHISRAHTIPEWLPWWLLGAAMPIEPTYFRLGLEFFTSRFVITRLSFMPTVTDTFLIDLVGTTISITLRTEQPYWKPCNPFETNKTLHQLSLGLQSVTGTPLSAMFHSQLHARATF